MSTLAAILFLAGCAHIQTCPTINIPPRPDLPTLSTDQQEALTQDTYEALVLRDALQKTHIDRLRGIVEAHNGSCI